MATEKTAVKLGAVRKCAAGGFIGSLFGSSKPETMTEKFARQDAEFKAKNPQQAQTPAAQAPSTTTTNTISGYAGMNAMQAREKAAGLKVGGMVRKKYIEGGEISGPGGPTDDLVPIDASNGEFMIKASSAKILGEDVLEALNDLGDEPKDPKKDAAEDSKEGEGMKCGGMVRKMAAGGMVDDELNRRIAQIPAGGAAPASDGSNAGSDFTRNVTNTAMALPGVGGALAGGTALASAVPSIARGASATAPLLSKGLGMVKTAAPYAVPAAGYATLQAASSNASPMPTPSALEQVPVKPAAPGSATIPETTAAPSASQTPVDEFSNAAISTRNPGGMVRKVGNSYSGSNVSGDVSFQGADGNALPGRPGGGSVVTGGMSPELIKKTLTNPDGSTWSAGDNAIMAANLRDGVDQYRGTSRDPRNDPMNQPMTKEQRGAKVRMAEIASQDKRYAQAGAREQEQLGMSRAEHTAKMSTQKQLADAQAEYLAAGDDPVKLKAAERKLVTLGGKQPAAVRQMVVPGGQGFDANGVPYTLASSVYDPDTKQFIQQGGPKGGQAALPPGMTKQVGTANGKPVYEDANGKRFQ